MDIWGCWPLVAGVIIAILAVAGVDEWCKHRRVVAFNRLHERYSAVGEAEQVARNYQASLAVELPEWYAAPDEAEMIVDQYEERGEL